MKPVLWTLPLLAAAGAACAQPNLAAASSAGAALDCMIQPHQVVQVGTAAAGVVAQLPVDRGDLIRRGQVVAQLNSEVERASLAVARERAEASGEVSATASAQEAARRELERASQLVEEQFVSKTYFDRQKAEAQVAGGRAEQAQERKRLAAREVDLASAQLALRTIRAPLDGVVVDRFVSAGEYVDQKPLLRIAAVDPLRVDVLVPAVAFGQVQVGGQGKVVPELLNRSEHAAVVRSVDRVIDAASNTFRVRLEMPNPNGVLPAGLRCKVDLGLKLPAPIAPQATRGAAGGVQPAALVR